ncbi:MAG: long-chain fatty acid--CoA ligase [Deltaproteobacteria bacterium]|nr:MAG: long-chain fatty acid--CoA ligase [Deltaproteobacteria bacterium]
MDHRTIPHAFLAQGRSRPDRPGAFVRRDGPFRPIPWRTYAGDARRAAAALVALGHRPGDIVAILGFNRPQWVQAAIAAMAAQGASAGIYTTCAPREVGYILEHSEAPVVVVEDRAQLEKVFAVRDRLPALRHAVLMDDDADTGDEGFVLTWSAFLERATDAALRQVDARLDAIEPEDLAGLIYTSGTTGPPKAVMLTHRNLLWTATTAMATLGVTADDCTLSYLPLAHIAEQMFTIHGPAVSGMPVYFATSIDALPDDLRDVQPTLFFGVPRVWEKFHDRIRDRLDQATGMKRRLVEWAMATARAFHDHGNRGSTPPVGLALQYRLAKRLVFDKLRPALGLGRVRHCVSGAAPIAPEILEFFMGLDLPIREVYGQSEDCGPTSLNVPGRTRIGTVGPPFPGVDVRIADDGEILVRGPNVFAGYYKDPEATAAALEDGWLHSGDLGAIDEDGFLRITGRKKDIIITAGGKNITPADIEADLARIEGIAEAVVVGDRRKFLSALLTFDRAAADVLRERLGIEGDVFDHPAFLEHVQRGIDAVNAERARVCHIRRFRVLPEPFSVERGELTPTMKIKRNVVAERHREVIDAMYAESTPSVTPHASP